MNMRFVREEMLQCHKVLQPGKCLAEAQGCCALAIMTKAPLAGLVKTRLCPPLTPVQAAALNTCFLQDIGRSIQEAGLPSRGIACYTPAGREDAYCGVLPDSFMLIPQRDGNLSDRLVGAIEDLLGLGFDSVCLINSDSPTVPSSTFVQAVQILGQGNESVVLGPTNDGGYYLIGMKTLWPRLFQEISWSTEKVLAQTLDRAAEIQVESYLLPIAYDVDDPGALERLCRDLLLPTMPSLFKAPATREYLKRWMGGVVPS